MNVGADRRSVIEVKQTTPMNQRDGESRVAADPTRTLISYG